MNMSKGLASCKYLWCVICPHGCPCGWQSPNMVNVVPTSAMYSTWVLYVATYMSLYAYSPSLAWRSHPNLVVWGCLGVPSYCGMLVLDSTCKWRGQALWRWLLTTKIPVHHKEKAKRIEACRWRCGGSTQEERSAKEEGVWKREEALRRRAFLCNGQAPMRLSARNALQRSRNDSNYS